MEYIHIISGVFITLIFILFGVYTHKKYKYIKQLEKHILELESSNKKITDIMNVNDVKHYVELFDKILLDKFNFHNYMNFLPLLIKGKEIGVEKIKSVKTDFYYDVSATLCAEQKSKLLKVYSEKGIELYIHQFFLQKLNELDVKFKTVKEDAKSTEPSDAVMKEIYKG
jgi:hypothetical protein